MRWVKPTSYTTLEAQLHGVNPTCIISAINMRETKPLSHIALEGQIGGGSTNRNTNYTTDTN